MAKILYVVTHMPCPPAMGAHHRVLNIARRLRQCGEVTMVYAGRSCSAASLAATRKEFGEIVLLHPRFIDGRDPISRFRYKFDYHCPWHCAYQVPRQEKHRFAQLRREHDLVWFHTLPAADCFGVQKWERSVMDLDDLNHIKFKWKAGIDRGIRLKIANGLLVYKWQRRERRSLDRFSLVTVCSNYDKNVLSGGQRIHVIPNGFASPPEEPSRRAPQHLRLGLIGNLAYGPNADGLKWFSREIWPLITRKVPQAQLRIVGNLPEELDGLMKPGYEKLGFLENTGAEFAGWSALVVPLRYGGGTRLKIVEALSKKCPIVSTSIGAHGLDLSHGKDILLADQPQVFASSCIKLLQDADYGKKLAEAGWSTFREKYTWDVIGETIKKVVNECVTLPV